MNEIIKGMANASEAIQENFTEQGEKITAVEQNIDEHLAENASESKAGHIKLPEPWTDLTLQNGWVAAGNVRVFKDPFGIVYLEILASEGTSTSGTVITSLHSKFCPTETVTFRIDSGAMTISTDGKVRFSGNHSVAGLLIINIVFRGAV